MSSVVISGNTSGTITLDAPAVAGTTTLTLPATSGTVVTKDTNGIASVNGIQFPATQSASADANTLDDYEEGTWTPTLTPASGSGMTFDSRGTYVKIGKQVTVLFDIQVTSKGTASGALKLSGLPFTRDTTYVMGSASIPYYLNMQTSLVSIGVYIDSNNTTGTLMKTTAAATSITDLLASDISAGGNTRFATTVTYFTA